MLTVMIGSSFHVSEAGEPETHRWEVVAGVDHGNERKPTCDSMMSSTPIPCSGAFVAKSGLRTTVRYSLLSPRAPLTASQSRSAGNNIALTRPPVVQLGGRL